jgi:hypothetical protein
MNDKRLNHLIRFYSTLDVLDSGTSLFFAMQQEARIIVLTRACDLLNDGADGR